ncbi:hypothetical protein XbC2_534 [Xanthomonas phage XbC2]|nr:hypothetical protein XbC2_534 [Xanthomonas phage XbC2]
MSDLVKIGDQIRLKDKNLFCALHTQNTDIAKVIRDKKLLVSKVDSDGAVREIILDGQQQQLGIYAREILLCFEVIPRSSEDANETSVDESGYGSFKIIVTYQDGKTIEEEGVTDITIKPKSVAYMYNRKKYGFIKYSGEVALELTDLKQITISTPNAERVFHIEEGVIIREHIMYDNERKFKSFRIGG